MTRSGGRGDEAGSLRMPALEWIAAAVGLFMILAMLGMIGWEAIKGNGKQPPSVEAGIEKITAVVGGYVVEVRLRNRSPSTAAAVEVEGELTDGDKTLEKSSVTVDYVPGASTRRAGLFFTHDPRRFELDVRALGYVRP